MNDYVSARKAAFTAIDAFEKSNDPTVRRQSICRTYYDLADTYPVGSDSMRLYVNRGITETKLHLDTLRCRYYLAVLAALDKENRKYRNLRDYCAADPMLPTISRYGPAVFSIIDDIVSGHIDNQTIETAQKIESTREMKFVAHVAEAYGQDALAFTLEKMLVVNLESKLSDVNQMRFLELSADLDNLRLHADLDKRSAEVTRWSSIATWLVALILVAVMAFTFIEMRNMRRRRNSDAKMIADLRVANEKVRLADAAKTRFVQNMSHEVRTPLNAIVGFSQLLALPDGSFPPEEKDEFAGHIVNNTKMLTMLLDDILNASAMDNGKYRIQLEEGELHFMGRAAISSSEHRLQPGVTMDYSSDRESPFTFVTDPRRVQQILINLLTNACKHTSSGHIDLNSRVDSKRGMVVYTVTDTGTGVPPEMAEAIFDRFTKLNDFVQGTGLGLSICRDIASRMGARVYLDTTYTEGGARFVFELPIVPPEIN